jgi:hypothetical protein
MPYALIKKGNLYAVKTKETGKTHGFTTKKNAEAQMRLLNYIVNKEVTKRMK